MKDPRDLKDLTMHDVKPTSDEQTTREEFFTCSKTSLGDFEVLNLSRGGMGDLPDGALVRRDVGGELLLRLGSPQS